MHAFVVILELMGTVAFALSGALTAMRKHMDYLGILVLAVITAVGGGILRDLVLGFTPPAAFRDPLAVLVAMGSCLPLFFSRFRRKLLAKRERFNRALFWLDCLGLGLFTVMGIYHAQQLSGEFGRFLLVFTGMISGVGGGVLRDLLAGNTPYIFVKHTYACASLAGALACVLLWPLLPPTAAMLLGALLTVLLRLLSVHFQWNLPRVEDLDEL